MPLTSVTISNTSRERERKRGLRSKVRRIAFVMFDDDEQSEASISSVPSIERYEIDEDEMSARAKRYKHSFLVMATFAIFFALYFPAAVMKGLERTVNLRQPNHDIDKKKKSNTQHTLDTTVDTELHRRDKENRMEGNDTFYEEEDSDPESNLGFDEFLKLQEERKKTSHEMPSKRQMEKPSDSNNLIQSEGNAVQVVSDPTELSPQLLNGGNPFLVPPRNNPFSSSGRKAHYVSQEEWVETGQATTTLEHNLVRQNNQEYRQMKQVHEPLVSDVVSGYSTNSRHEPSIHMFSRGYVTNTPAENKGRRLTELLLPFDLGQQVRQQQSSAGIYDSNQSAASETMYRQNQQVVPQQQLAPIFHQNMGGQTNNLNFRNQQHVPLPKYDQIRVNDPSNQQIPQAFTSDPAKPINSNTQFQQVSQGLMPISIQGGNSGLQSNMHNDLQGTSNQGIMQGTSQPHFDTQPLTGISKINNGRQNQGDKEPIQQGKMTRNAIESHSQQQALGSSTSLSPATPSHFGVCQLIVAGDQQGKITEQDKTCFDEVDPSGALSEIFLSTYLAHQGKARGIRVEYESNCPGRRVDQKLIQELLASPMEIPESMSEDMSKEQLQSFCKVIVDNGQQKQQSNSLDILLWDTGSLNPIVADSDPNNQSVENVPVSMLERLVPLVFANLYTAGLKSRTVKTSLKAGYGVLKGRDASSEHIAIGKAVIYIPCRDRLCQDLVIVPYMSYLMHIPFSVHTVDVVTSPLCLENLQGCRKYVEDLASTVRQFNPNMAVEVIPAQPSSPDVFARLTEAEHVLCGPGFGMTCLFPSLGRKEGRVTLFDVDSHEVEGDSASSFVSRLSLDLIKHISPPTAAFSVAFLSTFGNQEAAVTSFVQQSPDKDTGDCRFFRGRFGQWSQDMAYGERAQYRVPLGHYSGNAEKFFQRKVAQGQHGNMKFRPSTTYRWDELRYQTCQVTQITQEGVCDVLKSLGARRIFILGDSLNLQLAQSMWMWLTNPRHGDSPTEKGKLDPNFKIQLQCMHYGTYTLQFIRNDELLENDDPVSIDNDQKNCGTFCYPWTQEYLSSTERTVLIVNAGAHIHDFQRFQAAIDRFIDVFDGMNRPNDIVLFRTLVPGHWECSRPGLKPYKNYAEYLQDAEQHPNTKDEIYTWSKFTTYNDFAISRLDNRRFATTDQPKALMEVLDVFPTTVLRPDGHCSDEFRPPAYLDTDCLHYTLPGPIDWWSHLAFSHLLDIATAENYLSTQ